MNKLTRPSLRAVRLAALTAMTWGVATTVTSAQKGGGTVSAALSNAATEVQSSFEPVTNIMYAVCAIMGIVGAIQVYRKWTSGDPDTQKSAASWFGALIFAGLVVLILKAVFGQ